ncbi:MAG: DUF1501 domain-containing protein [Planctomycetes bacterium]|nr:DUF1501 domain-containing protein [Planctomycetota bacterium]
MLRLLLDRREWLRIGGLAGMGLALRNPSESASASTFPGFGKAKSVLVIHAPGGVSQFETWDPKPNAPAEIRGEFGSISTSVPGVRFGEHMPKIAKLADRLTVLRSMTHDDVDHGSATYLALTGVFHQKKSGNPPISPNDHPTYGSVVKRVRPERRIPYTAVHVNAPVLAPSLPSPGQNCGFLGRAFEPLVIGNLAEEHNVLADLNAQPDVSKIRLDSRRKLLATLDDKSRSLARDHSKFDRELLIRQAFDLLASEKLRKAFDLELEPERTRASYGNHRSGLACLMGRRLVEAGVPWVTVFFNHGIRGQDNAPEDTDEYGWDTHNDIFEAMKHHLLPRYDASVSFLLDDLEQRGLLDTTLVVLLTEFGRAPLVAVESKFAGSDPGRKHWASCYSIALAGAGIKRGATYGASDRFGAYPQNNAVTPGDLAATMFEALGINSANHFEDGNGRLYPIATGRPVAGLYRG